ncbi:MAG TPA: sugar transferase [Candidatus Acidoferrales bacterium]|nr:sugar transferase [Candidatus Acidoferrales bacterium]
MATKPILDRRARIVRPDVAGAAADRSASRISYLLSRPRVKILSFLVADAVGVTAAHSLAEGLARRSMQVPAEFLNPSGYFLFYVPFFTALLYLLGGYKSPDLRRPEKELELLFKGVSISFVALACANFVLFKSMAFSRYLLLAWYGLSLLFLLFARFSLRAVYASLWRRGFARQKAILLGSEGGLADFERRLAIQRYQGYEMIGVLADPEEWPRSDTNQHTLPTLGLIEDWEEIAEAEGARLIVVHLADSGGHGDSRVLDIVRRCQEIGIDVEVHSRLFGGSELRYERDEFSGFFRFYLPPRWTRSLQQGAKAIVDILIGLAGSAITLALTPAIGLLLKCEDGGTVFHQREYVGMDGRVHHFLKFRTMVEDAEQILQRDPALKVRFARCFKLKNDPRILRVGRFLRKYSLDEFPQFFSLLTGQLSFVGPRAISPDQRERYGELLPKLLSRKPGLTGFWQVMGRQTTTYEEKIQMDMFYIDHWSIWLDLVIIAKTFWEVLHAEGAY